MKWEFWLRLSKSVVIISHQNIVSYKEAFLSEDGQALCIIMEYADGGDLYEKIVAHKTKKTKFSEIDIWEIFI